MKIGMKLTVGFAVTIALLIIMVIVSIIGLSSLNDDVDNLVKDKFPKTVWGNNIIDQVNVGARSMRNAIITTNPEIKAKELNRLNVAAEIIGANIDSLTKYVKSDKGLELLGKMTDARKEYFRVRETLLSNINANNLIETEKILFGDFREVQRKYMDAVNGLIEHQYKAFGTTAVEAENQYNSSFIMLISITIVAIIIAILIAWFVTKQITKPINQAVTASDAISHGNLNVNLDSNSKDETGLLLAAMRQMSSNLNDMVKELNDVSGSAAEGKLDKRANEANFEGEYKNIMSGFNKTLDAVIGPLNMTAEYVDRISKGDIPPKITDDYKGDFNEIKNNLNGCIDAVDALVADAKMLAKATLEGKLDTRANANKHYGDFREIIQGVNNTLDSVIGPLNVAAEYVDRISKGDIPPKITDNYNGDFNEIKNNLNGAIDAVNALVSDAKMLADAAILGKLYVRANADKHYGDFKEIIDGVNESIERLVGLIDNIPAPVMIINNDYEILFMNKAGAELNSTTGTNLSKNKSKCFDFFKTGDCNTDKCACKRAMADNRISKSDTIAKPGHHILDIDYVGVPLKDRAGKVIGALEIVTDQSAIKKAQRLSQKVADYQEIETRKVTENLVKLSLGNTEFVAETTIGDEDTKAAKDKFDIINNALSQCVIAIDSMVKDAKMLAQSAVDGKLDTRADSSKHKGNYFTIVDGVNKTLDNVIAPINEAAEILGQMATGDLTVRMFGDYNGDLAKLKNDVNALGDSLSQLIVQVNESVQNTASAALEISSTAEGLAASSQEQSAQADEVASAVEEMSRTVTENAMSATRTAEVAQQNGEVASEGAKIVKQTVTKMRDIADVVKHSAQNIQKLGESSKQIGEIISVIDDIADQTNLLALNAAIEAARAGEQGRGFAVVADEVRKLAERTTEATKQIANMIKGIQSETEMAVVAMNQGTIEVQSGIEYADRAGESLNAILSSTQELLDMINQIAAASEEQSATSEQISKNVMSISKVTAESAQRVEDVAHTSEDLAKLTEHLRNLMANFQVEEAGSGFSSRGLSGKPKRQLNGR